MVIKKNKNNIFFFNLYKKKLNIKIKNNIKIIIRKFSNIKLLFSTYTISKIIEFILKIKNEKILLLYL